jgi:hypothetical protein
MENGVGRMRTWIEKNLQTGQIRILGDESSEYLNRDEGYLLWIGTEKEFQALLELGYRVLGDPESWPLPVHYPVKEKVVPVPPKDLKGF